MSQPKIIVGITGASGAIYGIRMLETLRELNIETHLVVSKAALLTLSQETEYSLADVQNMASVYYPVTDVSAAISSGSFKTMGMIIAPCSIRTMGEIASGATSSLLTRAADVCLKERRRLVMLVREFPFHSGHLRNMMQLSDMGAIIAPPTPAFYNKPETIDDLVNHTVGRTLDFFDIESHLVRRWNGMS